MKCKYFITMGHIHYHHTRKFLNLFHTTITIFVSLNVILSLIPSTCGYKPKEKENNVIEKHYDAEGSFNKILMGNDKPNLKGILKIEDDGNRMENTLVKFLPPARDELNLNYELEQEGEEKECGQGFWWHLRGRRCVPDNCFGGNKQRDPGTGECILKGRRRKFNKSPKHYFSRLSSYRRFIPNLKYFRGRILQR